MSNEQPKTKIPIADVPERKYLVVSLRFDGFSAAACPCSGQIATNSKLLAYWLYYRWSRFSYKHRYSITVMLMKRNDKGTYDTIKG